MEKNCVKGSKALEAAAMYSALARFFRFDDSMDFTSLTIYKFHTY